MSPELSWAQIREAEDPIGGATHTVHIHAYTPHNETLGADAKLEMVIEGGVQVNAKRLRSDADVDLDIRADPGQHTMTVKVYANDQQVDTLSIEVDIPLEPEPDVVETAPDAGVTDLGGEIEPGPEDEPEPPVASSGGDRGGCAGGSEGRSPIAVLALLALCWARLTRRSS